ncbi:4'-phosphopantetheinyl transferase superfamily protein [Streptomyces sp. NPDC051665]|uniref:4'-phosphopantetheinyl transferase family protein n=1 Tax=Streptomyces sp. NPDC051665 TaxID=3154647 RepID=UPI00343DFB12
MARLVPHGVAAVEDFGDTGPAARMVLHPAEARLVDGVVAERRREFTTVRGCARLAMAELGLPSAPLLPGRRGAPVWPAGCVGSMTHCPGYRAAVVGRSSGFAAIGIDAEVDIPLPVAVAARALSADERARLEVLRLRQGAPVAWDRLVFSVKEAVYKVWSPLTGRWLDYGDADVRLSPDGTFTVRLSVPIPPAGGARLDKVTGRWAASRGLLLAAVSVPAR